MCDVFYVHIVLLSGCLNRVCVSTTTTAFFFSRLKENKACEETETELPPHDVRLLIFLSGSIPLKYFLAVAFYLDDLSISHHLLSPPDSARAHVEQQRGRLPLLQVPHQRAGRAHPLQRREPPGTGKKIYCSERRLYLEQTEGMKRNIYLLCVITHFLCVKKCKL